jgi:hypothetical protein
VLIEVNLNNIFRGNEAWRGETRLCFGLGQVGARFGIMEPALATQPRAATSCSKSEPDHQRPATQVTQLLERSRGVGDLFLGQLKQWSGGN